MSIGSTTEKQFEQDIEDFFLSEAGGYTRCEDAYDPVLALWPDALARFVRRTQPKAWRRLELQCGGYDAPTVLAKAFDQAVKADGLLHVLRRGFKHRGIDFRVCYFRPESELNQLAAEEYAANEIACIRQWFYSPTTKKSVDMVLAVNGIPLFAFELKNPFTHQTINDAKRQWMYDRDPLEPCFRFNRRVLAFFCVDPLEAWMTTRLAGKETRFLPFNQGSHGAGRTGGKGNPPKEGDYPVSYLWREVFRRDSMMDIVQKFLHLLKGPKGKSGDALIFPRYHQLDVVRKLLADVKAHGPGRNYLIQHSAGSGKSNSIAWTAYRLASLHDGKNKPVFSSVVVVTDRTVLDAQLQETISGFDHALGSVVTIGDGKTSRDLRDALNANARIIVTTLQKFPVIYQEVDAVEGRNFAVIVDEAHSSQTGVAAQKLKTALADTEEALRELAEIEGNAEEELDKEDVILREMLVHGDHKNLSFFAFTATPKDVTLERFGTKGPDGRFHPFHVYSMRQAIEEGFILDVLENYMTYKTCFQIAKATSDNPDLPQSRAAKVIRKYERLHPYNISQKAQIIVETFLGTTAGKIGGRGKMMVVTDSRLAAVKYVREVRRYIGEKGYKGIEALVAFSGTVRANGVEFTEPGLNRRADGSSISEAQTKAEFHDNYGILIVAEKYQTGFDEPLLHTMIVDKKLRGVKAVQTLSRLNRIYPGKEDTFVLDFANEKEEILAAFQPFYQATELTGEVNADLIYQTQRKLRGYALYSDNDIAAFIAIWAKPGRQSARDLGALQSALMPACKCYNRLNPDERYEFRREARGLVRWYEYLAQVTRMFDRPMHEEYLFLKGLVALLPENKAEPVNLDGMLQLEYYKLVKTFEGAIALEHKDGEYTPASERSGGGKQEKSTLDEIIEKINEQYKGDFSDSDLVLLEVLHDRMATDPKLALSAQTSDPAIFTGSIFPKNFENTVAECYTEQQESFRSLPSNEDKFKAAMHALGNILYREFQVSAKTGLAVPRAREIRKSNRRASYPAFTPSPSSVPLAAERK